MHKNVKEYVLTPCFCGRKVKLQGGPEEWKTTYNDPDSGGYPYTISCECGMRFSRGCCDAQEVVALWNSKSPAIHPLWQVIVEGAFDEGTKHYTFVGRKEDVKRLVKLLALKYSKETNADKIYFNENNDEIIFSALLEYNNSMQDIQISVLSADYEWIDLPTKSNSIILLDSLTNNGTISGDELRYTIRKMEAIYE